MSFLNLSRLAVVVAASLLVGCASKPKETGFLSTYGNLETKSPTELTYLGPNLGKYSRFILDPITVKTYDPENMNKVKPEDLERIKSFFYAQLRQDLGAKFAVVADPGPGVARLRIAITDLKASTPALNVVPQTKMTGLGLGEASGEMELVDSVNNEQLAAAVVSQTGSRLSLSGLSRWGDAEAVMKEWSKRLVTKIEAAHGMTAAK